MKWAIVWSFGAKEVQALLEVEQVCTLLDAQPQLTLEILRYETAAAILERPTRTMIILLHYGA